MMPKTDPAPPSEIPVNEQKAGSKDKRTPLEEKSHIFEHRHWVNEACGDDLWKT